MIQPKQEIPSICVKPAIWWISVAFPYFLPFCVCCTCVSMQVLILRNTHDMDVSSIVLCLCLSLNRISSASAKLRSQQTLGICLSPPYMWCWVLSSWSYAQLLCGCWGLKFRSFCLISNFPEENLTLDMLTVFQVLKRLVGLLKLDWIHLHRWPETYVDQK